MRRGGLGCSGGLLKISEKSGEICAGVKGDRERFQKLHSEAKQIGQPLL